MKRPTFALAVVLALGASEPAAAQDSPLDALRKLIEPPIEAIAEAFRPRTTPRTPARGNPPALVDVPLPHPSPARTAQEPSTDDPPPDPTPAAAPPPAPPAPPSDSVVADAPESGALDAPAPSVSPVPRTPDAAGPTAPPLDTAVASIPPPPEPRLRPAQPAELAPAVASLPPLPLERPPPAARSTCGVALAVLGVEATALAPIGEEQCGIAAPVAVAALAGGTVELTARMTVECRLAETLADWLDGTVQPRAEAILGERVTGLRIAASYACRNRNGLDDARLSEHAKGNAVDISAFRLGDRWIAVGSGWEGGGADADFLAAVRESACGPFRTVLGPGADAYHSDHFHLDLAKRRGGGTFCQ